MKRGFFLMSFWCSGVFGSTIISVSGANGGGEEIFNDPVQGQTVLASWSQTGSYTGVSISAELNNFDTSAFPVTAYLTTQVGTSANSTTQIATSTVSVPAGSLDDMIQLFTGLPLGPGTYYLVLAGPANSSNVAWNLAASPTEAMDAGVTDLLDSIADGSSVDTSYAPGSAFSTPFFELDPQFDVEGTAASVVVPEPAEILLTGLGLVLAATLRTRPGRVVVRTLRRRPNPDTFQAAHRDRV